jgi:hypothetical protein
LGDRLRIGGNSLAGIMNFSSHSGYKTRNFWRWWSAAALAACIAALLWSSHEMNSAQTTVPELHASLDDQRFVLTDSGQGHQDATVQVTLEPVSKPSDTASGESIANQENSGGSSGHIKEELVDRTARPYPLREFVRVCSDLDAGCMTEQALRTEPIDPNWSAVTEGRLRDLWRNNVAEMPDEFLFVECKATVCEVTYRFLHEGRNTQERIDNQDRYFQQFSVAFRTSDLAAELRQTSHGFGDHVQVEYFKRKTSQGKSEENSKTSR